MKIRFWGTRGSLPSSFPAHLQRQKLIEVLTKAQGRDLSTPKAIESFIDEELPFHLQGTYGTNTLSIEVDDEATPTTSPKEYILLDAGTGIVDFIHKLKASGRPMTGNTFHIFISHLHWDHIQGFPFFPVCLPKGNTIMFHAYHKRTEATIRSLLSSPVFPIPFESVNPQIIFDIQPPETPFFVDGFKISSIVQNHAGVSYGYRLEKSGKVVVYSTDCEHPKSLKNPNHPFVQFYRNADLLIFDAMSSLAEKEQAGWGHSTYKVALEYAVWAQVKKLLLIHHDPQKTDAELDGIIPLAKAFMNELKDPHNPIPKNDFPHYIGLSYDGLEVCL